MRVFGSATAVAIIVGSAILLPATAATANSLPAGASLLAKVTRGELPVIDVQYGTARPSGGGAAQQPQQGGQQGQRAQRGQRGGGQRGGGWSGGHRRGGGYGGAAGAAIGGIIGGIIATQPGYYDYPAPYPGPVYPAPAYPVAPGYPVDDEAIAYCMSRYKSYDPQSMTYLGYDGLRHPCP